MFGITSISFSGYFLGTIFAYIFGLFVTFFTHGGYSVQTLFADVVGGLVCILFTDIVATAVWNLKKSFEED